MREHEHPEPLPACHGEGGHAFTNPAGIRPATPLDAELLAAERRAWAEEDARLKKRALAANAAADAAAAAAFFVLLFCGVTALRIGGVV